MPQPVPEYSMSYEGNRGDGVDIGQQLGAAIYARTMHQRAMDAGVESCRGPTAARGCSHILCSTAPSPG